MLKRFFLLFILTGFSLLSTAEDAFVINDIRIEGLQRVPVATVFANLPFNVQDTAESQHIRLAIARLFQTGNFNNVEIGRDADTLVVRLQERPAIADIKIEGNKAIKEKDLKEGLKKSGLSQGQILKQATLEAIRQELQRQYVAQGRYDSEVVVDVRALSNNRVGLYIDIYEGTVAKIKHLNIVGNQDFSRKTLLKLFEMRKTGWLTWLNSKDKYAKERMKGDLERLQSFYRDQGYLQFAITSTQVSLSPERDAVFITINIEEGSVYHVSGTKLSGEIILPENLMKSLILLKEGDVFSQRRVTTTEEYMTRLLGNNSYTSATVRSYPLINEDDKTVELTFFVDPGKRTYVNRIEFYGNTATEEEVLRREIRQMEAAPASGQKIEQSRVRLERLGFFKDVQSEMVPVPGHDDLVDIHYTVEEQHSGSIGASIGYADGSGLVLSANLQQNNFLGTGKQIGVGISRNDYQTSASFNYNNPYYTIDGVSRGFSVFYRRTDFKKLGVAEYSSNSYGTNLTYGYPISETARISFGGGYAFIDLEIGPYAPQEVIASPRSLGSEHFVKYQMVNGQLQISDNTVYSIDNLLNNGIDPFISSKPGFVDLHGDRFHNFTLMASISQSKLNRGLMPTAGYSQGLSAEVGIPGTDLEYYKIDYTGQYLWALNNDYSFRFHSRLGYGDGYGDTEVLPFFENYFAGGFGSVRGYERSTLGPSGTAAQRYMTVQGAYVYDEVAQKIAMFDLGTRYDSFGGNVLMEGGIEFIFPIWFIEDRRSLRTVFFIDGGNVFNTRCGRLQRNCSSPDLGQLRFSYGFGLTWISALGPLTFSLAQPFNHTADDSTKVFQFSIGTGF